MEKVVKKVKMSRVEALDRLGKVTRIFHDRCLQGYRLEVAQVTEKDEFVVIAAQVDSLIEKAGNPFQPFEFTSGFIVSVEGRLGKRNKNRLWPQSNDGHINWYWGPRHQ